MDVPSGQLIEVNSVINEDFSARTLLEGRTV